MTRILIFLIFILPQFSFVMPEEMTNGEYQGWIVRDGFGTYYLYNGCYVLLISKNIKQQFAGYENQPVKVNVLSNTQYMNPGDARIDSALFEKTIPDAQLNDDLSLLLEIKEGETAGSVLFSFVLKNAGTAIKSVYPEQLTFIITEQVSSTGEKNQRHFSVSNDSSDIQTDCRFIGSYRTVKSTDRNAFHQVKQLKSGEGIHETITYNLPDGIYYTWAGYGDNNFSKAPGMRPSNGIKFKIAGGKFYRL